MSEAPDRAAAQATGGAGATGRHGRSVFWEGLAAGHLAVMIIGTSWGFGGQAPWVREALLAWVGLGAVLFVLGWIRRGRDHPGECWTPLRDLWPLLLFDLLAGISCLNPSFQSLTSQGETYFVASEPRWWWLPSSARPDLTGVAAALLTGIVLSAYHASLAVNRRRHLRGLLGLIVANGAALAIFGTFQKLAGAEGLWFGLVPSPQPYFFSTFVYHNHWGAFTLLNLAAGLALLFHFLRRGGTRDPRHSPAFAFAVAALLLAVTLPLSASRSSSALGGLFLFAALAHLLVRLIRQRRQFGEPVGAAVAGLVVSALVAAAAVGYLARGVIRQRADLTVEQVTRLRTEDRLDARLELYRDTLRMARDKPWFGWGLDTYGDVFRIYNTFPTPVRGGFKPYYREAHNDWLQSLAESGVVGTLLLALTGLVPLGRAPWRGSRSPVPRYLLAGCGIVLLYALFEFPFANPSVAIGFWATLLLARRYAQLDARA